MQKFNVFDAQVEFDDSDPEGYRAGAHRFGPKVGGARIGATLYELPPGEALCPYHYESEEEWLLVLQGELTLRHAEGEDVLRAGDVTAFPVGTAGGHKTTNTGTETVRLSINWEGGGASCGLRLPSITLGVKPDRRASGCSAALSGSLITSSARARCGSRRMKPRSSSAVISRWMPDFDFRSSASFISSKDGGTPVSCSRA